MHESFVEPSVVASTFTTLTEAHLAQLRYKGTGPVYYNPTPRTILYRLSEVEMWIEASARIATFDGGELSKSSLAAYRQALSDGRSSVD